jgi:hypothetical protein
MFAGAARPLSGRQHTRVAVARGAGRRGGCYEVKRLLRVLMAGVQLTGCSVLSQS